MHYNLNADDTRIYKCSKFENIKKTEDFIKDFKKLKLSERSYIDLGPIIYLLKLLIHISNLTFICTFCFISVYLFYSF